MKSKLGRVSRHLLLVLMYEPYLEMINCDIRKFSLLLFPSWVGCVKGMLLDVTLKEYAY